MEVLQKEEAFKIMDKACENGINFLIQLRFIQFPPKAETAGITESWVGEWLKKQNLEIQ